MNGRKPVEQPRAGASFFFLLKRSFDRKSPCHIPLLEWKVLPGIPVSRTGQVLEEELFLPPNVTIVLQNHYVE
jgi:hypothetical protein